MRSLIGGITQALNKAPPYVGRGERLSLPLFGRNGAEQQMRAMGSVGTLFAIVNRTSNATSQVHWKLWRSAPSGRPEDRTEVTGSPGNRHLALDIWRKPNDFFTMQELVETTQQHVDLTGEGWWVVARNPMARSIPLELWPVRPDRMEPVPDRDEFISHYLYRGPNGEEIRLERDEVIQLRMPNPLDPYRGMGPVQSILTDLDSAKFSAEWNRNFFLNSAEPGGIIEVDKRLSDDEFDEMSTRWNEQHRGVANAHRVAIIEQGKWVTRAFSQKDMQFAELKAVSRDEIMLAFGIPKFAVGVIDDVNRATADAASAWFAEHLTVPRLERIKGALNNDFLPLFGAASAGLEFDYDSPVRPDREAEDRERESKAQSASVLVTAGWEPAAVLEATGLPPMPYVGTASIATPPPAGTPTPPVALLPRPARRALPRALDEDEREQWEDELDQLIADWQDDVTPDQVDEVAEQVEAAVDDGDLEVLADLDVSTEVAAGLLAAVMIAVAVAAAQAVLDEAAAAGITPPDVTVDEDQLRQQASVRAALMGASLAETVGREAVRVATPGVSGAEVAAAVRTHMAGMSDRWLEDQLGGAVWHAVHEGRFTTFAAIEGVLDARSTFVADERRDRNTCRPCRKINGREYDSLEAARADYPTSGYRDCDGGVRCRGTVNAVWVVD